MSEKHRKVERVVAGGAGAVISFPIAPDVTRLLVEYFRVKHNYDMPVDVQLSLGGVIGGLIVWSTVCFRDAIGLWKERQQRRDGDDEGLPPAEGTTS